MPSGITDIFLSQGLIGVVSLLLLGAVTMLYRSKESVIVKYDATLKAQSDKHQTLITVKDSVINKLQEDRVAEMKVGMAQITASNSAMEQAAAGFEAALDALIKQGNAR